MPIWLRKLTYTRIRDAKEEEANAYKKSTQKAKSSRGRNKSTTSIDMANLADKKKMPKKPHYTSKLPIKKR